MILTRSWIDYSIATSDSEMAKLESSETGERVFDETYVLQLALVRLSGLAE